MFVGGEFYYDNSWLAEKPGTDTRAMTFLNGGKACLMVISDYLLDHGINKILLPSYLCPTILNTLENCGLTYGFYQVRPDLSIDLEDLICQSREYRGVYFINYFGFPRAPEEVALLHDLRRSGKLLVEDNAQTGFNQETIGDFSFNSMRKFCAYDGGYLETTADIQPYLMRRISPPNRRLPLIREYRSRLVEYLFQSRGGWEELNRLYRLAELYYESDPIVEGDADERRQIEHLDWPGIMEKRRENYRYLLNLVSGLPELTPLFTDIPEGVMPLGLPVYIRAVPRDWLFDRLGEAGIGLTIHWDAILRDPRLNRNPLAAEMAGKMLTLVIDQRVTHKHLDYQAQTIRICIQKYRRD